MLTLDPSVEDEINQAFDPQAAGRGHARQPAFLRKLLDSLKRIVGDKTAMDSTVLLCASPARYHLRRLLEPFLPRVIVLSPGEIPNTVTVQSLGTLG